MVVETRSTEIAENSERRQALRDAAVTVLAAGGVRGLTHRQVDAAAEVPMGTTKNYFPTSDALLITAAERAYERYREDVERLEQIGTWPTDRDSLVQVLVQLIRLGLEADRPRLVATFDTQAEATRNIALRAVLSDIIELDFALYHRLLRSAGLPVTEQRARVFVHCIYIALLGLLNQSPRGLAVLGLDDLEGYVRDVLDVTFPE